MNAIKRILAGIIIGGSIAAAVLAPSCNKKMGTEYNLHEWGVMEGCYTSKEVLASGRPDLEMIVKQPVIYITSDGQIQVDIKERVEGLVENSEITTYPKAEISGNEISWNGVQVLDEKGSIGKYKFEPGLKMTLEELIPVLNNAYSNTLKYRGTSSKFLFYEADMKFDNPIELSYDMDEVMVKNTGDYAVENMIFVTELPSANPLQSNLRSAMIGKLSPGEERAIALSEFVPDYEIMKKDLMSAGFTADEAEPFAQLWAAQIFNPTYRKSSAQLLYRLPEAEYDRLIPLTASPKPSNTERAMYVLLDAKTQLKPEPSEYDNYEKYAYALPEEAKTLLESSPKNWEMALDPDYKETQVTCLACGWICYTTPSRYEWIVPGSSGNELEIRIRDVQCFGQVPIFYYKGVEYRPQLPIPELEGK